MNLTLTDLLTPVQIEQAHQALEGILEAIDTEQDQELTRIHRLFEMRRREARREAILKVLESPSPLQGEVVADEGSILHLEVEVVDTQDEDTGLDGLPDAAFVPEAPATSAPCNSRCYTARELAELLGIHPTSITNIKKDGLLPEPVPGTGGSPQNPYLYEIPDIEELRAKVEKRRVDGLRTAGEKLEAYKAGKAMGGTPEPKEVTIEPKEVAVEINLPLLLSKGKIAYPKGFFVGYHKATLALDVFEMPRPLGLPAGWAVCAIVEFIPSDTKLQMPSRWTCHIPTTIGVMRETAEAIKDLVMGEKKTEGSGLS